MARHLGLDPCGVRLSSRGRGAADARGNALRAFPVDGGKLRAVVDRIGPDPMGLLGGRDDMPAGTSSIFTAEAVFCDPPNESMRTPCCNSPTKICQPPRRSPWLIEHVRALGHPATS